MRALRESLIRVNTRISAFMPLPLAPTLTPALNPPLLPSSGFKIRFCFGLRSLFTSVSGLVLGTQLLSAQPANTNALRPFQIISSNAPPLAPPGFNPDAAALPASTNIVRRESVPQSRWTTNSINPPQPPPIFNPDPGALLKSASSNSPFFKQEIPPPPGFQPPPVPPGLSLPRMNLRTEQLDFVQPPVTNYGSEPLPKGLELPRDKTRANQRISQKWENPEYSNNPRAEDYPVFTELATNRWRIGFVPWRRYTSGEIEMPYETPEPLLWHPYKQSILKGDAPLIGQDIFLNLTATSETEFEARTVPTPSGISAAEPGSSEFFGKSEQLFFQHNFAFEMELFEGEAAFKPVHWAVRFQPVFNVNYTDTRENNVISPNPAKGTDRVDEFLALQQAFVEIHLGDLSDNYDFIASRFGNQAFSSDFRGFIFNDVNLGARIFGNYANNRWQYNLAVFDMREKDSNSQLNTFEPRDQIVLIANAYRQDFLWKGYTAELSFHANLDHGSTHYDDNGNLVRPAPLGTVVSHDVEAFYLGWAGDGHIGRFNVSHAFYQAVGHDDFNGLAGRPVDINAQFGAVEVSYDRDWLRYKASLVYASGDSNAKDGEANGFDTIVDNPNFTGGPFSWYVHQGFNLAGTAVNLKQRNSLVPDLRTSKTEGQPNFVNPGVLLLGVGTEIDITPKLRSFLNINYINFMETDSIKTALLTDKVDNELGWDFSIGFQYRPLLTDNIIFSAGFGALLPGRGFKDIYQTNPNPVPGYDQPGRAGHVDDFYYSGILALTFTY